MILIAGGSGYLGRTLMRALTDRGETVRIFDRIPLPALPERCKFVKGDIREMARCVKATKDCDAVVHLIGIMPQARAPESLMREVNVLGTGNLLRASVEAGVKRFVFLSSMEVYGRPERLPMREGDPTHPIGEYGRNKLEAEQLCLDAMKRHGIQAVIIRPSTLVGEEVTDHQLRSLLNWARRKLPLVAMSNGDTRFQMTSLKDCLSACLLALEKKEAAGQIYNIGSDDPPTVSDFIRQIRELTHNPFPLLRISAKHIQTVLSVLGKFRLSPVPEDHYRLIDATFVMDCTKAKTELGWRPTQSNFDMFREAYDSLIKEKTHSRGRSE